MLLVVSLVQSTIFLLLVFGTRWGKSPLWLLFTVAAIFAIANFLLHELFFDFGSPAVLVSAVLTLLLTIVCGLFRAPPSIARWGAVVSTVIAYGLGFAVGYTSSQRLYAMRAQYPLESMAERLAYEQVSSRDRPLIRPPESALSLSTSVEQRLEKRETQGAYLLQPEEQSWKASRRKRRLKDLHDHKFDEFVAAQGFGQSRMRLPPMLPETLELPPSPPIPFAPRPYVPEGAPPLDGEPSRSLKYGTASSGAFSLLHDYSADEFNAPERTGYIQDREHVAGFNSHRIAKLGRSASPEPRVHNWLIVRMELVSLLKHPEPRVYQSDHLPQMDQLSSAKTRPLDEFETRALEKLRHDEDLVVDEAPHRILMLGALRAGNDCRQCHTVQRGALLGAFSYELVPQQSAPPIQPPATPPPA